MLVSFYAHKKDHRVCAGLPLSYDISFALTFRSYLRVLCLSICLQFSLLLLQFLIFSVQVHRDADHDTQADDDKDDGQNYFTHDAHSYPLAQASTSDISPVL